MSTLPIVIDTDVDIDDWMAILYLLAHPGVEVRGVTVVGTGACHLEPGTQNALDLLELAGSPTIPVAKGLAEPMAYDHQFPADIREQVDDLYGLTLPSNPNPALPDAVAFLEKLLSEASEKIAIVAIGPLTNLGTLLEQSPELAEKIERIFIMGGAVDVPGNVHAADASIPNFVSEWNVYLDPVAADVVFRSGVPITLVPLDATRFVPVTEEFYVRILKNHLTPSAEFIYEALTQDFAFLESGAFFFWDPTAAVLATNPDLGTYRDLRLAVHTQDDDRSGQLLVEKGGAPVTVAFEVDGPAFDDLFLEGLNGEKTYKSEITFYLDGREVTLEDVSPRTLLIDFLHDQEVNRQGTKLACGEGGCGACTVMLTSWDPGTDGLVKRAINSCLRPLATLDGTTVTTVQGIGSVATALDPVQHTLAANNGSQCGYCSPGFVMNMYSLLQNDEKPTERRIEDVFDGNICRCTGYRPILAGFKKFACDYKPPAEPPEIVIDPQYDPKVKPFTEYEPPAGFLPYMRDPQPVSLSADGYSYYRPVDLAEVYRLKGEYGGGPSAFKLLVGNTQAGIFKTRPVYGEEPVDPPVSVDVSLIPELNRATIGDDGVTIGGAASLARLLDVVDQAIATRPETETRGLAALAEHVREVANTQVRNVASLAGNLYMAVELGFLSDLVVVLGALGATVTVSGAGGSTTYPVLELPQSSELPADSLYERVHVPYTRPGDHVRTFKVRNRTDDTHATVNAGFVVRLEDGVVASARLVYNGIRAAYGADEAPHGQVPFTPITLPETEALLAGRRWDEDTLSAALASLSDEVAAYRPPDDLKIDGVPFSYRESLARTLFYKMFVHVAGQVDPGEVGAGVKSAGEETPRPVSGGVQHYNSYPSELPVSLPLVKLSAFMQASGEAVYSHDVVLPPGTLEAAYVYSMIPRGTFHYVLPVTTAHGDKGERIGSKRLERFLMEWLPGVSGYVAYADVPVQASNWIGEASDDPVFVPSEDDEIPESVLAEEDENFHPREITTPGAPLGLVLARDPQTAQEAADFVRTRCIRWTELDPVLSLEQAIEDERFFIQDPPSAPTWNHIHEITRPGSDPRFLKSPQKTKEIDGVPVTVVSGVQRTSYQNHFYMETMGTVATPGEGSTITLHTSTQTLADNQSFCAAALGLQTNAVRVVLIRDGGAFGGKQSRSRFNSTAAAVAAFTRQVPVRLVMDRNTNMIMCGNRHAFEGRYHAAFDREGVIRGLSVDFYSDGGNTYDLSFPVMDLAQLNADNTYKIDSFKTTGQVCQTNSLSNTAFRSFGTIQSVNVVEAAIERVAHELGVRPEEVREKNFYKTGHPEWKSFEVTDLTIGVMRWYRFGEDVLEGLAQIKGTLYENRQAFQQAALEISSTFEIQQNMLLLEEYSTTSYDFTPYLQGLKFCDARKVWDQVKESSGFDQRVQEIERFNRANRTKKRGISMIPLKYGISYTGPRGTLNQGGAYVIAYQSDGSVLVQHGGVESGQGIETKMAQIAAETLDIPLSYVRMGDTDTNVISDASPTAASTGSDLNGGAVELACRILRERLEKFCEDLEQYTDYYLRFDPTQMDYETKIQVDTVVRNWRERWSEVWPSIVSLAYVNRINLASEARYKTPHYEAVDLAHPFGTPFFYFTYGAAAAEVEVDCLTGEWQILRADVTFDVGKSLNPLLDVGQMEGGFVQGVGCVTTEELLFQRQDEAPKKGFPRGVITSYGTWDYKPPGAKSIPIDFRVTLIDNSGFEVEHKGPRWDAAAVKSSKGIGEPPLVLANTVFSAIRQAVGAYRRENGETGWFEFDAPATVPRIQAACGVGELTLKG